MVLENINNLDALSANLLDVNFEQLSKVAYPSAWLGIPLPLHDKRGHADLVGIIGKIRIPVDPKPEQP